MMLRLIITILLIFIMVSGVMSAKFSGDAFSLGVGARSLALGGATIAGMFDASAPYWNPAGMNYLNGRNIIAMHAETFGSLLNHDFIAYVDARLRPKSIIKSFGFYIYYLGGGGIKITQLNEFNRPYVVREESHGDYLIAGSVSGKLKGKIDFGLTAKIIYRDVGTESGQGLTMDAGIIYKIKDNFNLGLMVTDITTGFIRYSGKSFDEGNHSESIYPTMKPGMMFTYKYKEFSGSFLMSGDIKFEHLDKAAQYHTGALSLDMHYGWELGYKDLLFGRFGYDIGRLTAGGGINIKDIQLDFAYLDHDELDESYRVSISYRF
jgi:hypothetical protein